MAKIQTPQFNRRDYPAFGFFQFLADYYTIEEMEKRGEEALRTNSLLLM
jgi:hypothetical protein